MTYSVSIKNLEEVYFQATKKDGLIDFTNELRLKNGNFDSSVTKRASELAKIFKNYPWTNISPKSGHADFQNKLVKAIHVGFSNHQDDKIYGDHLKGILHQVLNFLDVMQNQIFKIEMTNLNKPDYEASLIRYQNLFEKKADKSDSKSDSEKICKTKKK